MIQVGARNMQNFELLKELGTAANKPVLLKRGLANTIEELLMSAEYIMAGGNENVILCERGIRTFETCTRNTLDISAVPMLKSKTHLPVVVDPSHAAGIAWMVEPLAMAAIAAGADGLMIEVHNDPPPRQKRRRPKPDARTVRRADGQGQGRQRLLRQGHQLGGARKNRKSCFPQQESVFASLKVLRTQHFLYFLNIAKRAVPARPAIRPGAARQAARLRALLPHEAHQSSARQSTSNFRPLK